MLRSPSPSSCGYLYYIAFVDAYTRYTWMYHLINPVPLKPRYTWMYLLRHKSDATQALNQFLKLVQTQFITTVKAFQYDNGREFLPFTK